MSKEALDSRHIRSELYPGMIGFPHEDTDRLLINPEQIKVVDGAMQMSQHVKSWEVTPGTWVMSHALNLKSGLLYGDQRLQMAAQILSEGAQEEEFMQWANGVFEPQKASELWQTFLNSKFITPNGVPENLYQYYTPDLYDEQPNTRLLRVLLTDKCNLNCEYCKVMPFLNPPEKMHTPLSAVRRNDLDSVLDMFFDGSVPGEDKTIHISGGEPLIAPNEVKYIFDQAIDRKREGERIRLVLGTNAMLMTEQFAEYMAQNGIFAIVSMDGRPDVHNRYRLDHAGRDSFAKVDKGLQLIRKYGLHYGLSTVVGKHNYETLSDEIAWILDQYPETVSLGVNKMKPPTPEQKNFSGLINPEEYVEAVYTAHQNFRDTGVYLELIHRHLSPFVEGVVRAHDCGAASGTTINIGPDGTIGSCKTAVATGWLSTDMDDKERVRQVMQALRKRSQLYMQECQHCPALGICGNGCAYEAEVQHGDMNGIDEEGCHYTQLFLERFHQDLSGLLQEEIATNGFYSPTKDDRKRLYGNVKPNELTLAGSIGHTNSITVDGIYGV